MPLYATPELFFRLQTMTAQTAQHFEAQITQMVKLDYLLYLLHSGASGAAICRWSREMVGHDISALTYNTPELYEWFLNHKRG
jgi:hypothetical protein